MGKRPNPLDISVILSTRNRCDGLQECLNGLRKQTIDTERYEVIVVDDGSTDETWTLLQQRQSKGELRALRQQSRGSAAARNMAIEAARGHWILFIEDDIVPTPGLLQTHIETHRSRPESALCVLGHRGFSEEALVKPLARYIEDNDILFEYGQLLPMEHVAPKFFYTSNISVPRSAFDTIGLLDETFQSHGLDGTDLGFRLDNAGYEILYNPEAHVLQMHVPDLKAVQQDLYALAYGWVRLLIKHPDRVREWGDLRMATQHHFEDTIDEYAGEESERSAIIERLTGFHFDDDPLNPVRHPDTQRRILKTIHEQFRVLYALWWAQGFADGLAENHLRGFDTLLRANGRDADLVPRRTLFLADGQLSARDIQALYRWSSEHDEHTAGGLVIALDPKPGLDMDRVATQVATTVSRARPRSAPAEIRLLIHGQKESELSSLFLEMDRWLALDRPKERSMTSLAHTEGCLIDWVDDPGVVHATNLPGNLRIGVWPNWEAYSDLLALIDKWWPALSARKDCALVLFHSRDKAGRAKRSAQTLQELLDQAADGDHTAHVVTAVVPTDDTTRAYWRQNLDGVIQLESAHTTEKMAWLTELNCRAFFAPIDLERHLVKLHLLTDRLLGHAPSETFSDPYQEVHEQIS